MDIAELANQWLTALQAGDLEGVRRSVHPDITVWHNFGDTERVGVETMLKGVAELNTQVAAFRFDESRCDVFTGGFVERHIMRGRTASGEEMDIPSCMVATVQDGRIVRLEEYLDPAQVPALGGPEPVSHTADPPRSNREAALALFDRLGLGDEKGFLALAADDATWWSPNSGRSVPLRDHFQASLRAKAILKDPPFRVTVTGVTAEGDRVALEASVDAELLNGRIYSQRYHFLMLFRDGLITQVKEYQDTKLAADMFGHV
jgi:ketosteroid isomerase-like protein